MYSKLFKKGWQRGENTSNCHFRIIYFMLMLICVLCHEGRQPSDYQDLTARSRGIQVFPNGSLIVRQAKPEHQGQYLCEATNGIGAGLSATVSLIVHSKYKVPRHQISKLVWERHQALCVLSRLIAVTLRVIPG